ncbi:hypothetical protein LTR08_007779 [Meristemomyces frigidus]|nr:hypothetical protein LTR08_007779 [Meristemomyces frigidus]
MSALTQTTAVPGAPMGMGILDKLPRELRDRIYEEVVEDDRIFVLPHLFDLVPCGTRTFRRTPPNSLNKKIGLMTSSLNNLGKQFRYEYYEVVERRALNLEVGGIIAHVLDLNFDNLIDFLRNMTPAARAAPNLDCLIDIHFCFSNDFCEHNIDLNVHGGGVTSFGRWLEYRDQTERDGQRISMQYIVGKIEFENPDPIRWFINLYSRFLYHGRVSKELEEVGQVFREYFLDEVSYEDTTKPMI